jgi:sigma-B regulation protein RsbU (phosphoserine phosphatase)
MTALRANLREYWRRISRLDLIALAILAAGIAAFLFEREGGLFSFAKFLSVLAGIYLLFRLIGWWRTRLLWSLRNRLIVAYLFIAVVPVLLLLTLAIISGLILYTQLGGYLLYDELQHRVETISNGAEQIAAALENVPRGIPAEVAEKIVGAQEHTVYDRSLPGLTIEYTDDATLLHIIAKRSEEHFAGLIQQGDKLFLVALRGIATPRGVRVVTLRVPVTPEFIATLSPNLGPIQFELLEPVTGTQPNTVVYTLGNTGYRAFSSIPGKRRILHAAAGWWDTPVRGISKFEALLLKDKEGVARAHPVLAFFVARPSRLNALMFSSVGELGRVYVFFFAVVSIIFLLLEISALLTGIILTRRITKAVSDLYHATQYVQTGDLTHRVRIDRRDQLGVLGESFNLMTSSISGLIEEQKQRQRLENEISIAREVQNQLFPQKLPTIPGVEIEAICKAARTVSGDYYDFMQLSPTHLALAIADISGKGISAALLMASLQAALRSQMLTDGSKTLSTSELVSRLNKHLVRNTGDDRFATFFIGIYDSATRTLRYTNAGHLPSLLIGNGSAMHLDVGGMVLGVIEDLAYEEGSLSVPPDALFVAYSDGLVEPENVYGEEFGIRRLEDAAIRAKGTTPLMVAESLMAAAEEWAGTPEQADDMTVIVARFR